MNSDLWRRDILVSVCLLIVLVLPVSCAPRIKGWSLEAYRGPDFNMASLNEEGLALLPVMVVAVDPAKAAERSSQTPSAPYVPQVPPGEEGEGKPSAIATNAYRISLTETLLSKIKYRWPALRVISPGDCLKQLNDAGYTASYLKFDHDFPKVGVNGNQLKSFGQALDCRYIFISQAVVAQVESEATIRIVWSFGRKSVLRSVKISGEIWDIASGSQIWEGSGVGYNRLGMYEGAPLTEDIVNEAVERLLETIMP